VEVLILVAQMLWKDVNNMKQGNLAGMFLSHQMEASMLNMVAVLNVDALMVL
jgi:hypothetical protein